MGDIPERLREAAGRVASFCMGRRDGLPLISIPVKPENVDVIMADAADEIEQLQEVVQDLVTALDSDECHAVFVFYFAHGQKYSGPHADMNRARAVLKKSKAALDGDGR